MSSLITQSMPMMTRQVSQNKKKSNIEIDQHINDCGICKSSTKQPCKLNCCDKTFCFQCITQYVEKIIDTKQQLELEALKQELEEQEEEEEKEEVSMNSGLEFTEKKSDIKIPQTKAQRDSQLKEQKSQQKLEVAQDKKKPDQLDECPDCCKKFSKIYVKEDVTQRRKVLVSCEDFILNPVSQPKDNKKKFCQSCPTAKNNLRYFSHKHKNHCESCYLKKAFVCYKCKKHQTFLFEWLDLNKFKQISVGEEEVVEVEIEEEAVQEIQQMQKQQQQLLKRSTLVFLPPKINITQLRCIQCCKEQDAPITEKNEQQKLQPLFRSQAQRKSSIKKKSAVPRIIKHKCEICQIQINEDKDYLIRFNKIYFCFSCYSQFFGECCMQQCKQISFVYNYDEKSYCFDCYLKFTCCQRCLKEIAVDKEKNKYKQEEEIKEYRYCVQCLAKNQCQDCEKIIQQKNYLLNFDQDNNIIDQEIYDEKSTCDPCLIMRCRKCKNKLNEQEQSIKANLNSEEKLCEQCGDRIFCKKCTGVNDNSEKSKYCHECLGTRICAVCNKQLDPDDDRRKSKLEQFNEVYCIGCSWTKFCNFCNLELQGTNYRSAKFENKRYCVKCFRQNFCTFCTQVILKDRFIEFKQTGEIACFKCLNSLNQHFCKYCKKLQYEWNSMKVTKSGTVCNQCKNQRALLKNKLSQDDMLDDFE